MSNTVPEGWFESRLDQFAVLQRGFDLPVQNRIHGDVPIYGSNGVVGYHNEPSVKGPGVVTGRSGSIGDVLFVEKDFWALNTSLYIKDFHGNSCKYVYHYLDWFDLSRFGGGTGVPTLNRNDVHCISIVYPRVPEQQKIATILSSVDNVIEKTRAQIDKLKDLKTGMMQELLTKGIGHTEFKDSPVGRIPACWELVRLDKVTKVIDSLHQTPKFSSEGLPMIRIGDIRPGKVNVEKALKVSRDVFEQFTKNHKPKKGDLLMSRVGSYGVCCYLDSNIDLCLGQNTVVILPDKVNSLFLYYSIYSQAIQKQIEFEVAGSGYKSLSLASIRALKVTLPPANEQVKLVSILDSIDKNIDARNESLTAYKSAKKALMQDLLTGKVRVNLTDKESAAV